MSKRIYSLQWSAVENAQTYRVFRSLTEAGNKQELVLTSNRSLELNQYIDGSSDYYYFIKAQATGYQDSDYSTPLRWKTFSISRSVDTGVIETTDDSFVGEGFGYNTGFVAPGGKIFNRAVCLLTIGGIQRSEYISFLTDDKSFNIDIPAEAVTGDIVYSAVVQDEITQLATPTIAMNADGKSLEITAVENATRYDVYVDGTLKTNIVSTSNTTTFDLSTLSDITDGAHTVKVKAKASGYNDSEFSNEVSYTKAPAATFTQVYLTRSNSNNSVLSNMNTSKVYTIYGEDNPGIMSYNATLQYNNGQWSFVKSWATGAHIYTQTASSVEFAFGYGMSDDVWHRYIVLEGDIEATSFDGFTCSSDLNLQERVCFAENTLISTRSGDKFVQDITYDDYILVWNFDEGKLDYEKPIFIKQEQTSESYWSVTDEDNKTVNLVGSNGKSHRLYNKRTHLFEYPQDIPECKCEEIHESVKYYNIVTAYHFNCFANGILTSKRYSNMLYPITDEMKYDKTVKHTNTCKREQFNFLTDDEFEKLRLSEMEYSDEMCDEIKHFFTLKKTTVPILE